MVSVIPEVHDAVPWWTIHFHALVIVVVESEVQIAAPYKMSNTLLVHLTKVSMCKEQKRNPLQSNFKKFNFDLVQSQKICEIWWNSE